MRWSPLIGNMCYQLEAQVQQLTGMAETIVRTLPVAARPATPVLVLSPIWPDLRSRGEKRIPNNTKSNSDTTD